MTLAGLDPSGGAGILMDARIFLRHDFHAATVLTSNTVQNSMQVKTVEPVAGSTVLNQARSLLDDLDIVGIKIGLLGTTELAEPIARIVADCACPVVWDPVHIASVGGNLVQGDVDLLEPLLQVVDVITPNHEELAWLAPASSTSESLERLAQRMKPGAAIVLTGGDVAQNLAYAEELVVVSGSHTHCRHARVPGGPFRGTGCMFSSALLAGLAGQKTLLQAVESAGTEVLSLLQNAVACGGGAYYVRPGC